MPETEAHYQKEIEEFYRAIKDLFEKTWASQIYESPRIITRLQLIFLFAFFFTIIPVFPYFLDSAFPNFDFNILNFDSTNDQYDNWKSLLLLTSIMGIGLMAIVRILTERFSLGGKLKERLDAKYFAFCLLKLGINSLKSFQISSVSKEKSKAIFYFEKYLEWNETNRPLRLSVGVYNSSKSKLLTNLIEVCEKQLPWFKVDEDIKEFIQSYLLIDSVVINRIKENENIDELVDLLNPLLIYEYQKLKGGSQKISQNYFQLFSDNIRTLPPINLDINTSESRFLNKIGFWVKKISSKLNEGLRRGTLLELFLKWYLFLLFIFTFIVIGVRMFYQFEMDTKILAVIFSVPFAGAITFAATLYKDK